MKKVILIPFLFIPLWIYAIKTDTGSIKDTTNQKEDKKILRIIQKAEKLKDENNDSCLYYLDIAEKASIKSKNKNLLITTYRMIGEFYHSITYYTKALDCFLFALDLSNKTGNQLEKAKILNDIGGIYYNKKEYHKADSFYRQSLVISDNIQYKKGISATLNNIGEVLRQLSLYDEALKYYHKAEKFNKENNNQEYLAINYINEGLIFLKLNDISSANNYFRHAYNKGKEHNYSIIIAASLRYLGELHLYFNHLDSAIYYFNRSLMLSFKLKNKKYISENYYGLYTTYNHKKDYKNALDNLVNYHAYNDTIFNQKKEKEFNNVIYKYEIEKKGKKLAQIQYQKKIMEIKVQKRIHLYLIILTIIALLLSYILFHFYRIQRKLNNRIKENIKQQKTTLEKLKLSNEKIVESDNRYKNLFEISPFPIIVVFDGKIIISNQAADKFFKKTGKNSIIGKNIIQLVDDNHRTDLINKLKETEKSYSNVIRTETSLVDLCGEHKSVFLAASSITYEEKKALQIAFHDITERKIAEKQIKASQEKFRSIFEGANVGILATDRKTERFFFANPKIMELTGYTLTELLSMGIKDIHPSESHSLVMDVVSKQMSGNINVGYNLPVLKKNGDIIYCDISSNIYTINDKEYFIGFFLDVTDKRTMEIALQESEAKFRSFMETASDMMNIADKNLKLTYANKAFCDILGYNVDEIKGMNISEFYHPDERKIRFRPEAHEEFVKKGRIDFDTIWIKKDGTPVNGHLKVVAIYDDNGNFAGSRGVFHDLTDRKIMEQELIDAKEKAEESDRLKSAFLANISHEIRTPMNGIIGFTQLLNKPGLTEEKRQKYVQIINDRSNQLLALINDLIDLSKIESKQLDLMEEPVSLNSLMEDLYIFFSSKDEIAQNHISLEYKTPKKNIITITDKIKINQILINLIGNAIKFTPSGKIIFGYKMQKENLYFYVEDTGIGIPKDKQDIIFERFRQADETVSKYSGGTGLGLAISKNLVELMNGEIHVISKQGKGSMFYFTIPRKEVPHDLLEMSFSSNETYNWKNKTILIAEDDEFNFILLKEILAPTGIKIILAKNGNEAIELINDYDVDVILMDIKMPDMDGLKAGKIIRKQHPDIVIIAQTAFVINNEEIKEYRALFNLILNKPIDTNLLLHQLKLVLT